MPFVNAGVRIILRASFSDISPQCPSSLLSELYRSFGLASSTFYIEMLFLLSCRLHFPVVTLSSRTVQIVRDRSWTTSSGSPLLSLRYEYFVRFQTRNGTKLFNLCLDITCQKERKARQILPRSCELGSLRALR